MDAISKHLDGLDHPRRVEAVTSLGRKEQSRLFDAAKGYRSISIADIVPPDRAPMREVVHHGKNSLPAFTRFAKVFCRPDGDDAKSGDLWGYNRNSGLVSTAVGPGYFVAYDHGDGEVLVDYTRLPLRKPSHWPEMLPNDARLSRFVYNGTQDALRGVSTHVTIGRATKGGKPMDAWFVLCREDSPG
jgi:hypothetical protein